MVEVNLSLFAKQLEDLDLLHEDLEQIYDMNIEEMDINWQIAMIAIRMKKFYKKTGRRVWIDGNKPVGFDKKKLECFNVTTLGEHKRRVEDKSCTPLATISSINEANELYEKDEKLKKYRRIGMKAVKEKEQLQKIVDSWKDSSKNLWKLVDSAKYLFRQVSTFMEENGNREAELKKQRVFNTGNEVAKPVWNNANSVNHADHFVPRPVQLITVRQNVNSVRPNVNTVRANVNSVRQNVNSIRSNVNTGSFNINTIKAKQPINTSNINSFSPVRPQVNKFNQRSNFSKSNSPVRRPIVRNTAKMSYTHAVKGNWGIVVKTSAGYNWRKTRPNSNCNSGSNFIQTVNATDTMQTKPEKAWWIGLGLMTSNKDYLDDFDKNEKGNFGHFNLFSISQICDTQYKVLFTETECLVVSLDFKMPDENQILLKVPRQHNMYNFDMKTPALTKDYACLIAKATSDESKLWHRRLVITQHADQDDSDMPKLTIFNKPQKGTFDEASYYDEVKLLGDPKSSVQTRSRVATTFRSTALGIVTVSLGCNSMDSRRFLPHRAKVIGTYVYTEQRDERGVVVRNKARLVAQGYRREDFNEFVMGELIFFHGLQVKQKTDGIFISQDKYVADMLKKFNIASVKTAITPMETKMALTKDEEADEVDATTIQFL
ncbi:hypothetical protein Tco_0317082 [Tanacetum coccineum]